MKLKREIGQSTIIIRDFSIPPLSVIDRISTRKINEDIENLNNTISQPYFIGIYRIVYLSMAKSTLFSSAHGTFSKIDVN